MQTELQDAYCTSAAHGVKEGVSVLSAMRTKSAVIIITDLEIEIDDDVMRKLIIMMNNSSLHKFLFLFTPSQLRSHTGWF